MIPGIADAWVWMTVASALEDFFGGGEPDYPEPTRPAGQTPEWLALKDAILGGMMGGGRKGTTPLRGGAGEGEGDLMAAITKMFGGGGMPGGLGGAPGGGDGGGGMGGMPGDFLELIMSQMFAGRGQNA